MWSLNEIQKINSPEEIRKRLTQDRPHYYKSGQDRTSVPYLSTDFGRYDKAYTRLLTLESWGPSQLEEIFREQGPFLAARTDQGALVVWAPLKEG